MTFCPQLASQKKWRNNKTKNNTGNNNKCCPRIADRDGGRLRSAKDNFGLHNCSCTVQNNRFRRLENGMVSENFQFCLHAMMRARDLQSISDKIPSLALLMDAAQKAMLPDNKFNFFQH